MDILAALFDPVNVMDMTETWQADGDGWRGEWIMTVRGQPVIILSQTVQGAEDEQAFLRDYLDK